MKLPSLFVERMATLLPADELNAFLHAIEEEAVTSFRLNPDKAVSLSSALESVGWCPSGYYLPERPVFTADPLFHAGSYYVQEASSMFADTVVRQLIGDRDIVALDLCAAPGGKSTLLRSALSEGSLLVSNEVIRGRAQILAENMVKWGHEQTVVVSNAPRDFGSLPPCFDLLLADVPCSGEGMFRKDETAVQEWSLSNVKLCQERQRQIIADSWDCLLPGGYLIYSTCTYNTEENEENVDWICRELGGELVPIETRPEWQIHGTLLPSVAPVYRFMPHYTRGEGLFWAVIRKSDDEAGSSRRLRSKKEKPRKGKQELPVPTEVKTWVNRTDLTWKVTDNRIIALPSRFLPLYELWAERLYFLKPFLTVAEWKGKSLIPHHELAMSRLFNEKAFPQVELDASAALAYLRKEAIQLPDSVPMGYVMVTFKHRPLGFVKQLGNRSNNLYPQEWRVRNAALQYAGVL